MVEAIIGAAYLSQGVDLALKVAQKLRVAIADVQNFSDFAMTFSKTGPGHTINLPQSTLKAIETIVGGDISMTLLAQALVCLPNSPYSLPIMLCCRHTLHCKHQIFFLMTDWNSLEMLPLISVSV